MCAAVTQPNRSPNNKAKSASKDIRRTDELMPLPPPPFLDRHKGRISRRNGGGVPEQKILKQRRRLRVLQRENQQGSSLLRVGSFAISFSSKFELRRMLGLSAASSPAYPSDTYYGVSSFLSLAERTEGVAAGLFPTNRFGDQSLFVFEKVRPPDDFLISNLRKTSSLMNQNGEVATSRR